MTVVNTETGEIVDLDSAAAERRAERITLRLDAIAENYSAVMPMIREAIEKRDDLALGYRSPGEYVADRFGGSLQRLGVEVRRAVVGELTAAGLSTRAIAPVVGVNNATVHRDLAAVARATADSPGRTVKHPAGFEMSLTAEQAEAVADLSESDAAEVFKLAAEDEMVDDYLSVTVAGIRSARSALGSSPSVEDRAPTSVIGIDGKRYTRPTPAASPSGGPSRAVPRPAAEKSMNLLAMYADKAAREAKALTPDQIRRIRPEASHWTAGLRNSIEALQRLVDSPEQARDAGIAAAEHATDPRLLLAVDAVAKNLTEWELANPGEAKSARAKAGAKGAAAKRDGAA